VTSTEIFGGSTYTADRSETARAYSQAAGGGADHCECSGCRNFRLARDRVYPTKFLALLDTLGIDPRKEAEAYHNGRLAPGAHHYGGWFHFVGTLDVDDAEQVVALGNGFHAKAVKHVVELGAGFTAWMTRADAPRLPALEGFALVQLEFCAENVPWLLDEPEPG